MKIIYYNQPQKCNHYTKSKNYSHFENDHESFKNFSQQVKRNTEYLYLEHNYFMSKEIVFLCVIVKIIYIYQYVSLSDFLTDMGIGLKNPVFVLQNCKNRNLFGCLRVINYCNYLQFEGKRINTDKASRWVIFVPEVAFTVCPCIPAINKQPQSATKSVLVYAVVSLFITQHKHQSSQGKGSSSVADHNHSRGYN